MHTDADCRTQHGIGSTNAGKANYAGNYLDPPISLSAAQAPAEEEPVWPFGPTDEPVDTGGLLGTSNGVSGEESDDSLFTVEENPAQQLGFGEHIIGGLTVVTRDLIIVSILHYMWLSFGTSLYDQMVNNIYGQRDVCGDSISTADGSALTIGPTAKQWKACSNNAGHVLVGRGTSEH